MKKYIYIVGIIACILVGIAVTLSQSEPLSQSESEPLSREDTIAFYKQQVRVGDLQVGDKAPDFTLEAADGSETVQLSSFEGDREVVLIFGSYT